MNKLCYVMPILEKFKCSPFVVGNEKNITKFYEKKKYFYWIYFQSIDFWLEEFQCKKPVQLAATETFLIGHTDTWNSSCF